MAKKQQPKENIKLNFNVKKYSDYIQYINKCDTVTQLEIDSFNQMLSNDIQKLCIKYYNNSEIDFNKFKINLTVLISVNCLSDEKISKINHPTN